MKVQQDTKQTQLLKSALILTFAGIVTKILSAAYRIPFQNIAGDIGFYVYQQVYPFYGISLILSTYGFPVIISKLMAEQMESKNFEIKKVLLVSFIFLSIFFMGIFMLLYTGAEKIASSMGDQELVVPLKVVSFSVLFIPILSVLRGYFQGQNNMTPTAISQIGEQSVRVTTILLFSFLLLANGYSNYLAGASAVFGSITGGFCSTVILLYFWLKRSGGQEGISISKKVPTINSVVIIKALLVQGFTICISSLFLILIQLVDAMTLYSQLISNGQMAMTEAKIAKGIFDRGQPLIQLGTVVATSLSLTLVPLLSSAKVKNDSQLIKENVHLSIRIAVMIGLGAAFGLVAIIKPTNMMLFMNMEGSNVLAVMALTILFSSITMTTAAIMQGLGKSYLPALYVMIGLASKISLNYILIPHFGTLGAAIATIVAYFVVTYLSIRKLAKIVDMCLVTNYVTKLLVAGVCMVASLTIYQLLLTKFVSLPLGMVESRMFATFQSLSSVMIGAVIYLIFILKTSIFTEKELDALPFGKRVVTAFLNKNC